MIGIELSPHTPPSSAAAFVELYDRFRVRKCVTKERELEILDGLDKVRKWAVAHSPEVRNAYLWAISTLKQQIAGQVFRAEQQKRVYAAMASLPKPPEDVR